jgi:hypothetical protein
VAAGAVTGAVIGAAEALTILRRGEGRLRWVLLSEAGLAAGLGIGRGLSGWSTGTAALIGGGADCGLALGLAQFRLLPPRCAGWRPWWPVGTAALAAVAHRSTQE